MEELLHDSASIWLAAGAAIIAFEALTTPGLGLFLGGLGAISTALLIKAGIVGEWATPAQLAWCFAATTAWTLLLWKPLQNFRTQRKAKGGDIKANNLIGDTATVGKGGLTPGMVGQVIWSGALMNAELESSHGEPLPEGTRVHIRAVSGNILKVSPK